MLSQSWDQLEIMKNKTKTIKNEILVMADLILISAIILWRHVGYKLWKTIYASIEKVIAH